MQALSHTFSDCDGCSTSPPQTTRCPLNVTQSAQVQPAVPIVCERCWMSARRRLKRSLFPFCLSRCENTTSAASRQQPCKRATGFAQRAVGDVNAIIYTVWACVWLWRFVVRVAVKEKRVTQYNGVVLFNNTVNRWETPHPRKIERTLVTSSGYKEVLHKQQRKVLAPLQTLYG